MNHIQRCLSALARHGRALLALAATAPAALASLPLPETPNHMRRSTRSSPLACPAGRSP
jgi:hypothetical protein